MSDEKRDDKLAATVGLVLPEVSKQSAKYLETTMKNALSEDIECDPDIETSFQAQANAYKINSRSGKKQLEKVANIANSINDKFKGLMRVVEKYGIPLENPDVERFVKRYRAMCSALKNYSIKLKNAKTDDDIQIAFRTLNFEHNNFVDDHDRLKIALGERASYEPKSYMGQFWSLIKWVWNYKYIIYISGLLLYNINIYVFPEDITLGLNFTIRITGAICYTFASDRVAMQKAFEFFTSLIMLIGSALAPLLLPFLSGKGIKIPGPIQKLFKIGSSIVFYLFTYFTIDWISHILKLICNGILITGAVIHSGEETMTGIWNIFAEAAAEIGNNLTAAAIFIKNAFIAMGDKMTEMMAKLFVGVLYEGVINPTVAYTKALPGNIWKAIKAAFTWSSPSADLVIFEPVTYDTMDEVTRKALAYAKSMSNNSTINESNLGSNITMVTDTLREIQSYQSQTALVSNQFLTDVSIQTIKNAEDIYKIGQGAIEKVKKKIKGEVKSTFEKMGTKQLWEDLKKLKFRNSIVPYMIGIMLVLSVLSIMFGIS